MPLLTLGLWLLCGFSSAVFAAVSLRGRWSAGCAAAGFGLAVLATDPFAPIDVALIAVLAGLVATLGLTWPRHWILTSLAAGVLAGVWTALFEAQGAPAWLALPLAASLPVVAAVLTARRPGFASAMIRDEALLLILVLACVMAVAPGVQEGWRAATTLSVEPPAAAASIPAWTLTLSLAAIVLGGAYTLWSRR